MTYRSDRIKEQLDKNPFLPISSAVANVLREDILTCRIAPNSRLKEGKLSEDMNVSRTTVRRALEILMREELVIKNETQGVRVVGFNEEVEQQLNDYRSLIEPLMAKTASLRRTEQDLWMIHRKLKALEVIADSKQYIEADISFHESICRATHNAYLISAAQIYIDGLYRRKVYWSDSVIGRYKKEIHYEHVQIYNALVKQEPERAYEEAFKHSENNYSQRLIREIGHSCDKNKT